VSAVFFTHSDKNRGDGADDQGGAIAPENGGRIIKSEHDRSDFWSEALPFA